MPVRHFDEIGELYSKNIDPTTDKKLLSEETVGSLPEDGFAHANKDATTDKAFNDAGPEAAENFEVTPNDSNKKKDKKSAYNEKALSNPVQHNESQTIKSSKRSRNNNSNRINNSTMKETNNKSTFDRLFEDVMGEDFEEFGDDAGAIEIGGEEGEEAPEEMADTVTLELPRDLAEGLHEALMDQLGGGSMEGELEDLGDAEELDVEDESYGESHVDLQPAPDTVSKLATQNGGNNKVEGSGHTPAGGTADASASGQGGDGSPQKAPEGFTYAKTKNNKVGGKVKGGNQDLFKA